MNENVRYGLALLVVAALTFLMSLPVRGSTGGTGYMWLTITSVVAVLSLFVGAALLVIGLLKPQRD